METALREGVRRIQVRGQTGSGRTTLALDLADRLGDRAALVLLPPADDIDAPIHGLYQVACHLAQDIRQTIINDDSQTSLKERARRAAESLYKANRTLLLVVPASWHQDNVESGAEIRASAARAREFMGGLLHYEKLNIVVFGAPDLELPTDASSFHSYPIQPLRISPQLLEEPTHSPRYADAVRTLRKALAHRSLEVTPLQIRLAVGLVALGEPVAEIAYDLELLGRRQNMISSLGPLVNRLVRILTLPKWKELRAGLRRLARARYPLPNDRALAVADIPDEHNTLVLECIGFGDGTVRINELVRRRLLAEFAQEALDHEAHDALAAHHRALDGQSDVLSLSVEHALHWLEKVHHYAHGSADGRALWAEQNLRARDFYWDLGWSLSVEKRDYKAAADVYRQALLRFGEDSYTCHYLAYNLDRAGEERREAEALYRRAIELDPANPWWNSRLVTFLIGQARFRAARTEWSEALDRIDPDRERVSRNTWLASQVHRWVVTEWLDHGQVEMAREAFDEIPLDVLRKDARLLELKQRLEDAEEARALGESVYPASIPMHDRWRGPHIIPEINHAGASRVAWYPGRVVEASASGVTLVVATPDVDPAQRRVIVREMSPQEWLKSAWCPPELATGFVEIGRFADDEIRILPLHSGSDLYSVSKHDQDKLLRYVKQW